MQSEGKTTTRYFRRQNVFMNKKKKHQNQVIWKSLKLMKSTRVFFSSIRKSEFFLRFLERLLCVSLEVAGSHGKLWKSVCVCVCVCVCVFGLRGCSCRSERKKQRTTTLNSCGNSNLSLTGTLWKGPKNRLAFQQPRYPNIQPKDISHTHTHTHTHTHRHVLLSKRPRRPAARNDDVTIRGRGEQRDWCGAVTLWHIAPLKINSTNYNFGVRKHLSCSVLFSVSCVGK